MSTVAASVASLQAMVDSRFGDEPLAHELSAALEQLNVTTEELQVAEEQLLEQNEGLRVAEEELLQSNEELMATRAGLEAERQRYRELFEQAPDGYLVTDGSGVIRDANRAACALLGVPCGILMGKPLASRVVMEDRRSFRTALNDMASHTRRQWEGRIAAGKGVCFDAVLTVNAMPGQQGELAELRWLLRDVSEHKREEAARRDLLRRLVLAQEEERSRVARELHDQLGQQLTALSLGLKALEDSDPGPPARPGRQRQVQQLREMTDDLMQQTHRLAWDLRPAALDDWGLQTALHYYCENWSQRSSVPVSFHCIGLDKERLPPELEATVYRVVQESLTNVRKHAQASTVNIRIERKDGHLLTIVEDDGVGFAADAGHTTAADRTPLGLVGMQERVAIVSGRWSVQSAPGRGTTITARIPCEALLAKPAGLAGESL